jgi:hypothetical protein
MKLSNLARQLLKDYPLLSEKTAQELARQANATARKFGTSWATEVVFAPVAEPKVLEYDGYHAESRTGIRAGMAALKKFWSTYHYVPTYCKVALPLV